jgi:hypothetical protein
MADEPPPSAPSPPPAPPRSAPAAPAVARRRNVLNVTSFGIGAAIMAVWQFGALLERGLGWNSVLEFLFFVVNGGLVFGVIGLWLFRLVRGWVAPGR